MSKSKSPKSPSVEATCAKRSKLINKFNNDDFIEGLEEIGIKIKHANDLSAFLKRELFVKALKAFRGVGCDTSAELIEYLAKVRSYDPAKKILGVPKSYPQYLHERITENLLDLSLETLIKEVEGDVKEEIESK